MMKKITLVGFLKYQCKVLLRVRVGMI